MSPNCRIYCTDVVRKRNQKWSTQLGVTRLVKRQPGWPTDRSQKGTHGQGVWLALIFPLTSCVIVDGNTSHSPTRQEFPKSHMGLWIQKKVSMAAWVRIHSRFWGQARWIRPSRELSVQRNDHSETSMWYWKIEWTAFSISIYLAQLDSC